MKYQVVSIKKVSCAGGFFGAERVIESSTVIAETKNFALATELMNNVNKTMKHQECIIHEIIDSDDEIVEYLKKNR